MAKTLESELSELATERAGKLKGLSRRDRDKMTEITQDFHQKREALIAKYKNAGAQEVPAEKPAKHTLTDEEKAAKKKAAADKKADKAKKKADKKAAKDKAK